VRSPASSCIILGLVRAPRRCYQQGLQARYPSKDSQRICGTAYQEPVAHGTTWPTVTDKSCKTHQPRALEELIELAQANRFFSNPFLEADLAWIQSSRSSIYRGIIPSWPRMILISSPGHLCATGSWRPSVGYPEAPKDWVLVLRGSAWVPNHNWDLASPSKHFEAALSSSQPPESAGCALRPLVCVAGGRRF
jgi:hypothetical protein